MSDLRSRLRMLGVDLQAHDDCSAIVRSSNAILATSDCEGNTARMRAIPGALS